MLSDKGVLSQPCQDQSWNISRKLYLPVIETGLPKTMYSGGSKSQLHHEQYYDILGQVCGISKIRRVFATASN